MPRREVTVAGALVDYGQLAQGLSSAERAVVDAATGTVARRAFALLAERQGVAFAEEQGIGGRWRFRRFALCRVDASGHVWWSTLGAKLADVEAALVEWFGVEAVQQAVCDTAGYLEAVRWQGWEAQQQARDRRRAERVREPRRRAGESAKA